MRIPITDEQSPIPRVFDQLVDRLLTMDSDTDAIFNCQQGRGRTSTGLVITCLLQMIMGNEALISDPGSFLDEEETYSELTNEEDYRKRYLAGEWKVILQLIAVLQFGKLAKKLTDKAIDMCEHLQNLRVAIFDYKLRIDALEVGSKKFNLLYEIGCNYLVRYFYLIAFADYLLEVWPYSDRKGLAMKSSYPSTKYLFFSQWLKDRREIVNIIKNQSLD